MSILIKIPFVGSPKMNKFVHVIAAVIIMDVRFLCAQRDNTKYQAYKWEFPGGKVEPSK